MRTAAITLLSMTALLLGGCHHRELCYDHEHWIDLRIEFDWSADPDADPETMVVWFFPEETGTDLIPRSYEFGGRHGGLIRIPAGKYRAICFNGGTETLLERGSSYEDFHITTDFQDLLEPMNRSMTGAPRPEPGKDQDVKKAPETLWSDASGIFELVPSKQGQSVAFGPVESTSTISIHISGVENIAPSQAFSAAITGLSESWSVSGSAATGNGVTMPVAMSVTAPGMIDGEIKFFGHCADTDIRHILTLYTSDKYYYNFDVTDRLHNAPDPRHIRIDITGLRLPDPEGTGMEPSISDWGGEHIDIDML